MGRPENDPIRLYAMTQLGNGLSMACQHQTALSVREAELSILRRLGLPTAHVLGVQGNLANSYEAVGRLESALQMKRDVYSGRLKLLGEENEDTLIAANNYANCLLNLERFEAAKPLLRKTIPMARRVLGDSHELTLKMRCIHAWALYGDPAATLKELRKAVTMLEETAPIARRVLGSSHPVVVNIEKNLGHARETLRAREEASSTVLE